MMQEDSQQGIGRRVRAARVAAGLTQEELSGLVGRSVSWMESVEAGRMPLDRFSVICSIAEVCDVDPVWILGQPYRLRSDGGTSGHAYIPAQTEIAEACRIAARKLGPDTPAGARLENTGQFLLHVIDDLTRSARHWHQIYPTRSRETSEASG
ncbi:helix-turn-helix domain-containing protein [Streptomyces hydrogenans]|uniref:helix-turn-helix domain-containing protein n=2 Tax=Streptomyces hydrogenans TaxID=1873719 RepID=UPI0036CC321C